MDPVLCWKIIEGQQLLPIFLQAGCCFGMFQLVGGDELIKGPIGILPCLGRPDLM